MKKSSRLCLGLGAIVMSMESDTEANLPIPDIYARFLVDQEPNIALTIHTGIPSYLEKSLKCFDSNLGWHVLKTEDKATVLETTVRGTDSVVKSCVLPSDLSKGDVYLWNLPFPKNTDWYPLTVLDQIIAGVVLANGYGLMLHALGINLYGQGIMFIGDSGAGKSTLAALWRDMPGVNILSDEYIILSRDEQQFRINGTPWHSRVREASPEKVPLNHIFFIEHGSENRVLPISRLQSAAEMTKQAYMPYWDRDGVTYSTNLAIETVQRIPAQRLAFMPDPNVRDFVKCLIFD